MMAAQHFLLILSLASLSASVPLPLACTSVSLSYFGSPNIGSQQLEADPDISEALSRVSSAFAALNEACVNRTLPGDRVRKKYFAIDLADTPQILWGIGAVPAQTEAYVRVARQLARTSTSARPLMCQTGLNCGHSALALLEAHPSLRLVSFDLPTYDWSMAGRRFLAQRYGERHTAIDGNSRHTVPAFHRAHPGERCELVVIDGDHSYLGTLTDLANLQQMSACNTTVLMDDVCDAERCHAHKTAANDKRPGAAGTNHFPVIGPTQAWNEAKAEGRVRELQTWFAHAPDRGWVLGESMCASDGRPHPFPPRFPPPRQKVTFFPDVPEVSSARHAAISSAERHGREQRPVPSSHGRALTALEASSGGEASGGGGGGGGDGDVCAAVRAAGGATREAIVVVGDCHWLCEAPGAQLLSQLSALHLRHKLFVAAIGEDVLRWSRRHGLHAHRWDLVMPARAAQGSPHKYAVSSMRFRVVPVLAACGVALLVSDIDVAFLADPWPYLRPLLSDADVLPMSDGVDPDAIWGYVHSMKNQHSACCGRYPFTVFEHRVAAMNIGFFALQPTARVQHAFEDAFEAHLTGKEPWEQITFNKLFMPAGRPHQFALRARVLNPYLFPNSFFYDQRIKREGRFPYKPLVVHANYISDNKTVAAAGRKMRYLDDIFQQSWKLPLPPLPNVTSLDRHWDSWWLVARK